MKIPAKQNDVNDIFCKRFSKFKCDLLIKMHKTKDVKPDCSELLEIIQQR